VARIVAPSLGAGIREGLAGAAPGPDGPVVGPSGEPERERPAPDPGKEMALGEPGEISGGNIGN